MLKAKILYAFICTVLYAFLVYHNHKQNDVVNFTTFNRLGFSASVANYNRINVQFGTHLLGDGSKQ